LKQKAKEKALQKERPQGVFRRLRAATKATRRLIAFRKRKAPLLKKLDQNFH